MTLFRHNREGCSTPIVRFVGVGAPRPRFGTLHASDWQLPDGRPAGAPGEQAEFTCPDCGAAVYLTNRDDLTEVA
jgi:hypothetical protein